MKLRLRLGIEWLVIGLVASLLILFSNRWEGTRAFDHLLYDQLSGLSRPDADRNILLVNIDDHSLGQLGKWPWPRRIHGQMIEKLQTLQPKSITLDIILSEDGDPADDAKLARAMAIGPAPVMIPLHFVAPGSAGRNYNIVPPAPIFAKAAASIGHVNVNINGDGVVRRAELCFDPESNGNRWPHLMEQIYRSGKGHPSPAYRKVDCAEPMLVPYAPRGSHNEISYADLLVGEVPKALIAGRDVIIGATAAGLGDRYSVPFGDGGTLAGSEVMANILRGLRQDAFIAAVPRSLSDMLSLMPLWLLMVGFLRWSPRTALTASLFLIGAILIGTAATFKWQYWFAPSGALLGILIVYPLWGWRRLQAMSDFMASELLRLERGGETVPVPVRKANATDLVGRQSAALASAIDHMKDLRRFVSDTLSDLPDPMLVTDSNGIILLDNDRARARLPAPLIGHSIHELMARVADADHRIAVDLFLRSDTVLVGDKVSNEIKFNRQNSDGKRPHSIRFDTVDGDTYVIRRSMLKNSTGALQGHIYYFADITLLAAAEVERERILQLLSHDMRAPQAAIISSLGGPIDQEARQRIERNARRTIQLAQDFVDIARMAESKFDGGDILLADLIHEVADSFWPLAKERNLTIIVNDNSDAGFVTGEADSLSRAVANLIDNAIKFSPDHGHIKIDIDRIEGSGIPWLSVSITDQGEGIGPDILPNLFGRFVTGGKQHGRIKGAGLGLTYVAAVIKRHGGSISGENGVDGGACFKLSLAEATE